jgi:hypothetical protein
MLAFSHRVLFRRYDMAKALASALRALFLIAVAVAFSVGAAQLSASARSSCDNPGSGEIGTCPPFDNESCDEKCDELFGTFGSCNPAGCCVCAI